MMGGNKIDPPGMGETPGGEKGKIGVSSGVLNATGLGSGSERGKDGVSAMRLPQRVRERFFPSLIRGSPW